MNYKILIPQLYNPNLLGKWDENGKNNYNKLSFKNKQLVTFNGKVESGQYKFSRHANARNKILEIGLDNSFTHVFWMDTDVIQFQEDIIEKLLKISDSSVVAPYVFIEENDWWLYKRFYDISCFLDSNGRNFNYSPPLYNVSDGDKLNKVNSVGTCFLIPAEIHRKIIYNPIDNRNEHISFFEKVRESGYNIYATPDVEIQHAFLPKYGESFH